MSERKRVYISGPVTGMPDLNFPAFNNAERILQKAGYATLNPATYPEGLEYQHYMDISMAFVRSSEKLLMLDGWENSAGASAEHAYAKAIGLDIHYSISELVRVAV
jgi:hypothetical protein